MWCLVAPSWQVGGGGRWWWARRGGTGQGGQGRHRTRREGRRRQGAGPGLGTWGKLRHAALLVLDCWLTGLASAVAPLLPTHPCTRSMPVRLNAVLPWAHCWWHSHQRTMPRPCAGKAPSEALCRASVSFFQIAVGLVVPLMFSCWHWQPPKTEAGTAATAAAADERAAAVGLQARVLSAAQRAVRCTRRAVAYTDNLLHTFSTGGGLPGGRILALWHAVCSTWMWCRLASHL